jgi:hypothetical protein
MAASRTARIAKGENMIQVYYCAVCDEIFEYKNIWGEGARLKLWSGHFSFVTYLGEL